MFDFLTEGVGIWIVAALTWVIIMLGVAQLSRFYRRFCLSRSAMDAHLLGLAGQVKRMQSTLNELLVEQRKANRISQQLLDLKQAEMTGDFEIIEEPIESKTAEVAEAAAEPPPPLAPAPSKFPEIQ